MIITNNEAALRVKCEDVSPEEAGELIAKLESELKYANSLGRGGIGLVAPQIGIAKNIAIVRLDKNKSSDLNLINCKILSGYDPVTFRNEGCLSFPGRVEDTTRFQEIHVGNNLEYPETFVVTGLLAVVVQHEIDHLNSSLFMDHIVQKKIPIVNKNKIGPNEPCFCNSGKKFKKCCGKNQ